MKAGWQSKTIGDVCTIVNGATPKTGVPDYWNGDHLWITPAEMGKRRCPYVDVTERRLTDDGLANCSARLLPPYSVILSSRAPIGHLVINTAPMATNQGCKGLIPNKALEHKFLFHYLAANVTLLNELGTGTTFKELSGGKLKEVPVPLPPLPEQRGIVSLLDEAFAGLDAMRATAEKNLQNARAIFDSHLESLFGRHNAGWEKATLQDVCDKITDGTHQTPKYFVSGFVFLSSRNVTSGTIDWKNIKFIDESQHLEMQRRVSPKMDDLLLAKNGTTGVAALVDRDIDFDIYVSLALLRPNRSIRSDFLLLFINSPIAKQQFNKRLKGVGVPNLHLKEIREVQISYPKLLTEQQRIAEEANRILKKVQTLESLYTKKLAALDELKQSILQKAFAGELTSAEAVAA